MHTIGLIYNPHVEAARVLGEKILAWLTARQVQAWLCAGQESVPVQGPAELFVTLGGDGTILRTMQRAAPAGVPVLGINLGRVGFLTEASPETWEQVLTRVLAGEGWIEIRAMLRVTLLRDGVAIAQEDALNDAVISRGALARTLRLETSIDGAFVTRYVADGLILATATGSTAYAYAAGGPILPPWHNSILLVPAAPHLSLERPLVLDKEAVIEVRVNTEVPGMLTVDGRMEGELHHGDLVRIERSPLKARFLRLRSRNDFYRTLVARLTPRNGE
ncbi:MAG TPA: NAD(+)/NADH kinase [Anaerolineae bacterium]|nr:NAD(+)/NADH kinase [Anaerolineae bacterium]HQK15391.1 NAD(+)/NADH kinase [Anaerolineae bacterium]